MNEEGFIKLYRKILSWEWADDNNMLCFFIRLLFVVNYQDKQWHGITIKRGSFVTSMDKLCELMKMSKSAVKRCLENLRTTGEISQSVLLGVTKIPTSVPTVVPTPVPQLKK